MQIDSTPTNPEPPQTHINAAACVVPDILANVNPDHNEEISVVASQLVSGLRKRGHSTAASKWAIHQLIQETKLKTGLVTVHFPSVGKASSGFGNLYGRPRTPTIEWFGGGSGTKAIPKDKPTPFDSFRVVATESLWTWWKNKHEMEDNVTEQESELTEQMTIGDLVATIRSHDAAYEQNSRVADRQEAESPISGLWFRTQTEILKFNPSESLYPDIGLLEAICNQEWGESVNLTSVLKLRGGIATKTGMTVEQIDGLTLREAAAAWHFKKDENRHPVASETKGNSMSGSTPTAFISYSWDDEDHRNWVKELATRLRSDGVDVTLDQWEAIPGDQLPQFMESAIRDNQYALIVCTENYKQKSDSRCGGAGYEGDIMSAELFTQRNQRKFIPIMRGSDRTASTPTWLSGKYSVDFSASPFSEEQYRDLLTTLHGARETAPPLGKAPKFTKATNHKTAAPVAKSVDFEDIKIEGIAVDEVGEPKNDNIRGSALYVVPFRLTRSAPAEWAQLFVRNWDSPPQYTTRHRPGIARVSGDRVTLTRTTVEEVRDVHRETLKLVINVTNAQYKEIVRRKQKIAEAEARKKTSHAEKISSDLDF
jgi:hypothetical protein